MYYQKEGKHYGLINYCAFQKHSSTGEINGVKIEKQLVLVSF